MGDDPIDSYVRQQLIVQAGRKDIAEEVGLKPLPPLRLVQHARKRPFVVRHLEVQTCFGRLLIFYSEETVHAELVS